MTDRDRNLKAITIFTYMYRPIFGTMRRVARPRDVLMPLAPRETGCHTRNTTIIEWTKDRVIFRVTAAINRALEPRIERHSKPLYSSTAKIVISRYEELFPEFRSTPLTARERTSSRFRRTIVIYVAILRHAVARARARTSEIATARRNGGRRFLF